MVGERLPAGTPVHLVDDLIYSGNTLRSAMDALERVGLTATSASAVLWTRRAQSATTALAERGLRSVACLVSQLEEPE